MTDFLSCGGVWTLCLCVLTTMCFFLSAPDDVFTSFFFLDRSWWATGFPGGGGGGPPPFHLVTRWGLHCWFSSGVFWVIQSLSLVGPPGSWCWLCFWFVSRSLRFCFNKSTSLLFCNKTNCVWVFGFLGGVVPVELSTVPTPHDKGSAC